MKSLGCPKGQPFFVASPPVPPEGSGQALSPSGEGVRGEAIIRENPRHLRYSCSKIICRRQIHPLFFFSISLLAAPGHSFILLSSVIYHLSSFFIYFYPNLYAHDEPKRDHV